MQTKSIVAAALLSVGTVVASQNAVAARAAVPATATDVSAAQLSQAVADELNYLSSVYEGAAYSSVVDELATGVPTSVLVAIETLAADATGAAFSSILSLLPPDAQSFYVSIESQAASIIASDLSVTSTGTASSSASTMSTAATTSKTTTASGATASASTGTSGSTKATSATSSGAATATTNAATQPTGAVMAAGAAAAGILGLVALL